MACNAWTEILSILNGLQKPKFTDYGVKYSMFNLSTILSEYPLFDIKRILDRLHEKDVPELYRKYLLDHLIGGVQAEIEGSSNAKITYDLTEAMDSKLRKLLPAMTKLREMCLLSSKNR